MKAKALVYLWFLEECIQWYLCFETGKTVQVRGLYKLCSTMQISRQEQKLRTFWSMPYDFLVFMLGFH